MYIIAWSLYNVNVSTCLANCYEAVSMKHLFQLTSILLPLASNLYEDNVICKKDPQFAGRKEQMEWILDEIIDAIVSTYMEFLFNITDIIGSLMNELQDDLVDRQLLWQQKRSSDAYKQLYEESRNKVRTIVDGDIPWVRTIFRDESDVVSSDSDTDSTSEDETEVYGSESVDSSDEKWKSDSYQDAI